jgi:hypothetical protein
VVDGERGEAGVKGDGGGGGGAGFIAYRGSAAIDFAFGATISPPPAPF